MLFFIFIFILVYMATLRNKESGIGFCVDRCEVDLFIDSVQLMEILCCVWTIFQKFMHLA